MIILLSTTIIAESIDNNKDSFLDIDDFDLEDEGTDIDELKDDDVDFIILLFNTLLKIIIKEDEIRDRLVFSL